jgi:hypothetical protein
MASLPDAGFRAVATFNTRGTTQPGVHDLPSFAGLREFDEFSGDLVNVLCMSDVRGLAMFDWNVADPERLGLCAFPPIFAFNPASPTKNSPRSPPETRRKSD